MKNGAQLGIDREPLHTRNGRTVGLGERHSAQFGGQAEGIESQCRNRDLSAQSVPHVVFDGGAREARHEQKAGQCV